MSLPDTFFWTDALILPAAWSIGCDDWQLSLSPGISLRQQELPDSRLHSWMLANGSKLMQTQKVAVSVATTLPNMVFLLRQMSIGPATLYIASNLANAIFSIPIKEKNQKHSVFSWDEQQNTFMLVPKVYGNSPTLCHNTVQRGLDCSTIPQNI